VHTVHLFFSVGLLALARNEGSSREGSRFHLSFAANSFIKSVRICDPEPEKKFFVSCIGKPRLAADRGLVVGQAQATKKKALETFRRF
jgi:hypothetical protein